MQQRATSSVTQRDPSEDRHYCSECLCRFIPAPQNAEKQETCGSRACKLARIKRMAIQRQPVHKVPTMQARSKERAAARQRELEFALAGWGPEPMHSAIDNMPL